MDSFIFKNNIFEVAFWTFLRFFLNLLQIYYFQEHSHCVHEHNLLPQYFFLYYTKLYFSILHNSLLILNTTIASKNSIEYTFLFKENLNFYISGNL